MSHRPSRQKSLREYVKGLSIWGKIGWTVVLGYIVGRIVYWISKLM
jgi:hypothetical protein